MTVDRIQYTLKKYHNTGLNILPEYLILLYSLSRGNIRKYLKYLYYKYHKQILNAKIAPLKKTATANYQPRNKNYIQIRLNCMEPYIWDKYWDLRRITGYSISFIIRVFLEWELELQGQRDYIYQRQPLLRIDPEVDIYDFGDTLRFDFNNYYLRKKGNATSNSIYVVFVDNFG